MAQVVQRHIKSMDDEIEEMRRTKLYTQDELRLVLKTRTEFEYKINGVSKNLKDFMDYILYEKVLLKQIHNRRDKSLIAERKSSIEYKILKRIKRLYELALHRFSSDFSLCLSYFKFCKQSNYISAASVAIQNMIKNCSQNPKVWQVAATWYAYDQNDLNEALKVLNKGLTTLKNSKLLYTEAIKLELSVLNKNESCNEELERKVCQKIETYIHFICERINDSDYLVEILSMLELYNFTTSVQNLVIEKLLQNHSDQEFIWHTLAQREKRGLHYGRTSKELEAGDETCLSLCFSKYQEGLKKVSSAKKADLWSMYLDCLIEAQQESNELPNSVKNDLLKTALEQAARENYLTEKYYIKWMELVTDEEALHILEKGTSSLPHSVDLWKFRLRYAVMTDKISKVDEVFKEGKKMLKERALPLWFMYLRYFGLLSRNDIIDRVYLEAIEQPPEISEVLKPRYLEWLAITKGINEARDMYNKLVVKRPYCKELHLTMSKLESAEMEHNYEIWGRVHKLACEQFGEEDVDVWINCILFYIHFYKSGNVNEKVQEIHQEAEKTLSTLLLLEFREKYENILRRP